MKTHDISGGIIAGGAVDRHHAWIGCFMSEPGGGWEHITSDDLVHWRIEQPFQLQWNGTERFVQAGAVGVDDDGQAFAVECTIDSPGKPAAWRNGNPSTFNLCE